MMNTKKVVIVIASAIGTALMGAMLKNNVTKKAVLPMEHLMPEVEKCFGGIPLSKLNEIAKGIHRDNYCTLDPWGYLVLHYKSNRGHQNFQTQMDLDDALKLFNLNGGPAFPGQTYSHAGEFVKRVNEAIQFIVPRK